MSLQFTKPFVLTIFGASGDLAKLKLFPSLYALSERKLLPEKFLIIGYARTPMSHEAFRQEFLLSIVETYGKKNGFSAKVANSLLQKVFYFSGQYDAKEDFVKYEEFIIDLRKQEKLPETALPKLAYFSVPPFLFQSILENIALTNSKSEKDVRIILEKPFGNDEKSAQKLFHFISRYYSEEQIYLLDHYLGKGAVKSILSLRHANSILNMLLKGREIASIQISAVEDIGVEQRIGYFDQVGIIKDMFQSHLTQLLAMITMSIPLTESAESFQREKYAILSALSFSPKKENLLLGQYASYRKIPGVKKNSRTETFMAVKLKIDRESWYGVPIFIRTGKKLSQRATYIAVEFKKMPFQKEIESNRLIFELAPDERLQFRLLNTHGSASQYEELNPTESISCADDLCLPEYAALILDILNQNKLHFLSFAEIIAAWRITDAILRFRKKSRLPLPFYEDGVKMPKGEARLFRTSREKWFEL